jgi:hypothetical protein
MVSNSIKKLLLGSAAGLFATVAAQAADLPVTKAAAVQYVKVCTAYGPGFIELPGSDVCLRHFGQLKLNTAYGPPKTAYDPIANAVFESRVADTTGWQWTARPGWDFRTPTEYGTLRWVVQWRVDQRQGIQGRTQPRLGNSATSLGAQAATMHRAYVEWNGWTLGRQSSQFVYYDQGAIISALGGSPKTTVQQLTYAFKGPGFDATIGLEDSVTWISGAGLSGAGGVIPITAPGVIPPGATFINQVGVGPQTWYDLVGTISSKQAWGDFKISGALHQISSIANGTPAASLPCVYPGIGTVNSGSCPTARATGWAALAGITINLPAWGDKDALTLETTYADGALAYTGVGGGATASPNSFERTGQWVGGLLRNDGDAHAINNGNGTYRLETEKAWGVIAQLTHYWNPNLRSNLIGSGYWLTPGTTAQNTPLALGGQGKGRVFDAALNIIWGNRKTAEIGVEVMYKKINQDVPAGSFIPAGIDVNPSGWGIQTVFNKNW